MSKQVVYSIGIAITPSDATSQPGGKFDAVFVGGAGNVTMVTGGSAIAFNGLAAGSILPVGGTRVNATGTTATGLVALYGG